MGQELEIGILSAICLAMIGLAVCFREAAGPVAAFVRCASVFTGVLAILTAIATADSAPFLAISTGVIGAGFVGTLFVPRSGRHATSQTSSKALIVILGDKQTQSADPPQAGPVSERPAKVSARSI